VVVQGDDIARRFGFCGLFQRWCASGAESRTTEGAIRPLSGVRARALDRSIRDRMTEVLVDDLAQAQRLFAHATPQPMATVDILGRGREALSEPNASMGLALAPD
jgi:hypothetical protein